MFRKRPKDPLPPPTWLFVGLGNPGPEYRGTRHNVGFEVIDQLAERHKIQLSTRKHKAVYGIGMVGSESVILAKPLTYMNLSGESVAPLLREYRLGPDRLVVVTDELDLEVGDIKFKPSGGAGGHNGHRSLIKLLGTQDYARIRIGIGKPSESGADHVLSRFTPTEQSEINAAVSRSLVALEVVASAGLDRAIAETNTLRKNSSQE